jgi:predicted RNA-binding Zn-ribbon protein involved in translation (DUF1610 family)
MMNAVCPHCGKYHLTYLNALSLASQGAWNFPLTCPQCGRLIKVSASSRAVYVLCFLIGAAAFIVIMLEFNTGKPSSLQYVVAALPFFAACFGAPLVVANFEFWHPTRYWLPKSRLLAYTVYLVVPLLVLVGLFVLGIRLT